MKSPNKESLAWSIGSIITHVMLVNAGVRPVAEQAIQNYCVDECVNLIKKEGLQYLSFPNGETHTSIFIYKHSYLKDIVNFIMDQSYNKRTLDHWVAGKMFGYSDEKIARFVENIPLKEKSQTRRFGRVA